MRLTRVWLLLLAGSGGSRLCASAASHLYRLGEKAEIAGHIAQAFLYYSEAAGADPRKALYRQKADALAPLAALEAQVKPPDAVGNDVAVSAGTLDGAFDSITEQDLAAQRKMLSPPRLVLPKGVRDYDLTGDDKSLFEQAAGQMGLRTIFDSDFPGGSTKRFRVHDSTARDALHGLELATNSFVVPLAPKLMVVAHDIEQKRKELEQEETVSVSIPTTITGQELAELGQAVKQAVGVEHVFWDSQANEMVLRDRISRVLAAQALLNDILTYRGQVAVDLEFIELTETEMIQVGADLQTTFPVTFLAQALTGNTTAAGAAAASVQGVATLAQLGKFSLGRMFGLGIANADVIATLNQARGANLLRATLVTLEGQKATFHSGEKYPIITSQFVGAAATNTTSARTFTPTPSFTFQDLGIVLNLTAHVHAASEVSMEVDAEYKVLGAQQENGIPIISGRKITTTVRLRDNQWALIAGLTQDATTRSLSGPAFFSRIPLLGHIISHFTRNKAKTYIVMALKPHVLSGGAEHRESREVYVGTQTKTVTPL